LSQQAVATRLRVTKATISRWETGKQRPPAARLAGIIADLTGPSGEGLAGVSEQAVPYGETAPELPGRIICEFGPVVIEIVGQFRWTIKQVGGSDGREQ